MTLIIMHFIGIICKALVAAINIIWEKTLAKFDLKISIRGGHGKTKVFPGGDLKTFLLLLPREQSPGSCLLRSRSIPLEVRWLCLLWAPRWQNWVKKPELRCSASLLRGLGSSPGAAASNSFCFLCFFPRSCCPCICQRKHFAKC